MSRADYNRYRNFVTKEIRNKKKLYYDQKFRELGSNMKGTWNLINGIMGRNNRETDEHFHLLDNSGEQIDDSKLIANSFNNFFVSIGQQILDSFSPQNTNFLSYLTDNYLDSFFVSPVSANSVKKIILSLKNKSCNARVLPVTILKKISDILAPVLSELINKSLIQGKFPSILKDAIVIPVHKDGSKHNVNNYRPISILSTYSKIFEKVMYSQLSNYFEYKNIFNKNQYGFRSNKSTTQAMLSLLRDVYSSLDNENLYFSIFLDLKKAFDSVSHTILLSKLSHYGVRGAPLSWFRFYLSGRTQRVFVNGETSCKRAVTCGVPQGSVLGGLCFLIFFNDFHSASNYFNCTLFADDSTLSVKFPKQSLPEINLTINRHLISVNNWLYANKLMLNSNKTKFMIFSYRGDYNLDAVRIGRLMK